MPSSPERPIKIITYRKVLGQCLTLRTKRWRSREPYFPKALLFLCRSVKWHTEKVSWEVLLSLASSVNAPDLGSWKSSSLFLWKFFFSMISEARTNSRNWKSSAQVKGQHTRSARNSTKAGWGGLVRWGFWFNIFQSGWFGKLGRFYVQSFYL